jgi:hypothetical protein
MVHQIKGVFMQYHPETIKTNIRILATELKNLSERAMPKDLSFFVTESGIFEHNHQIITQAQGSFAEMTAPTAEDRQQGKC